MVIINVVYSFHSCFITLTHLFIYLLIYLFIYLLIYLFTYLLQYTAKLDRNLMLTASNGKQMKAFEVFGAAIHFLKEHFLKTLNNQGNRITVNEVRWVLTIPAIWDDSAVQFMRESAGKVI